MYDATDFLLSTTSIRHVASRRLALERITRALSDDSIASTIAERISTHARRVEDSFAASLAGLVAA
jgi:DNA-directed RNA polymerase specialized sigma54-like protein